MGHMEAYREQDRAGRKGGHAQPVPQQGVCPLSRPCSASRELISRTDAKTKSSDFETSARKNKLDMYKEIISFYHQETNNRMYNKRWEELHDPALVKISLEQRLEQGSKGKDAANA